MAAAFQRNSKEDYVFKEIFMQKGECMPGGGVNLDISKQHDMTQREFKELAQEKLTEYFGNRIPTITEAEDRHWLEICQTTKLYAMNNPLSLFGDDCHEWNLDRFTSHESLIHYEKTHHSQAVRILLILIFLINKNKIHSKQ